MMKRKLLFSIVALLCSIGAWAQGWTSSPVAAGDFYLYNVGATAYFSHGGRYGTHATVDNVGIVVNLTKVSDNVYTIGTNATYSGKFFNSNGYADSETTNWTFEAVEGKENTYKIKNGDNYAYVEWGLHNVMVGSDPGNSRAYWKLVTSTNRSTLTGASSSNPQDVTHLFDNPNFNYGNGSWTGGLSLGGNVNPAYNNWDKNSENDEASWNNHNPNVESYNSGSFNMYQTKTGLTTGFYRVTCQGFYRAGDGGTTATTQNVSLYANDASSLLMNINSGAQAQAEWNYTKQVGTTDLYVPDAQYQASNVLSTGAYSDNSTEVNVTNGSLTIGVKKTTKIDKDWTVVDNFHVYYLGNPKATLTTLQETIDSYLENATYTNVGGSERTALTSAKTLTAASETAAAYEAALSTVQDAIDAFVAAKDNYDALAAINAKITAVGTLTYASSAKKPSTHEGTSSSDAATYAASLTTALRAYVESNALGEGVSATNYTNKITNAICPGPKTDTDKAYSSADGWDLTYVRFDGGGGWTGSSTSHDVYFASNGYFWGNFTGSSNVSLRQVVSDLPTGKYLLTVRARSSGAIPTFYISGNGTQQNITHPNGVFGNNWDDTSVLFPVGNDGNATIQLKATKESDGTIGHWFSADNFQLVRIGNLDAVTISETATSAPTAAVADVTLTRTLSASYWNTFSVPFNTAIPSGWAVKEFDSAEGNVINFKDASTIEAGKPYLVKPTSNVENPTFNGVTVVSTSGSTVGEGEYQFAAQIYNKSLATDGTIAYLAPDASIKKLTSGGIKGLRAYFIIPKEATARIAFIDEGVTEIQELKTSTIEEQKAEYYNLRGQRVEKPTKGLYIVNGKKVVK